MNHEAMTAKEADRLSMLALAHVGDAVYELLVRTMLTKRGPAQVQDLHRSTVTFVRAEAQAKAAEKVMPLLSEEEAAVYRRGIPCRNRAGGPVWVAVSAGKGRARTRAVPEHHGGLNSRWHWMQ